MSKWKFEHGDFMVVGPGFYSAGTGYISIETAVLNANKRLEEWLRDAKVVYGTEDRDFWCLTKSNVKGTTHKAILINIEPIDKKSTKASDIVHTVLRYFDVTLHPHLLESATKHIEGMLGEPCRHEASKVVRAPDNTWECSCGARVKPSGFEAVKE